MSRLTRFRSPFSVAMLTIAALFLPEAGQASDGVLEINQTCAMETGCFPDDNPGFPVSVWPAAGARSFRLTSDLILPDANATGIRIYMSNISIDLNGFTIARAGCESTSNECIPSSGSGSGIATNSSSYAGTSVRNGSVVGMGLYGLELGIQSEVRNIRARWNRLNGIVASTGSTVSECKSRSNGSNGISVGSGSIVSGNTARSNENDGIYASTGSTVQGNAAAFNGGDGITALSGSLIQSNTVRDNERYGLQLSSDAAYRENVISSNTLGTVNGTGTNAFYNVCNGSTTCP